MSDTHLNLASLADRAAQAGVRTQFVLAALAGAGLLVAGLAGLGAQGLAAIALSSGFYLTGAALAFAALLRSYPHDGLGLCNIVTLSRLALASALLAPLLGHAAPWAVFAVAAVALSLDGVDGWLARRDGRASDFGARFDMEVDAALALILALNSWAAGTVGVVVLLIGLPRYLFAAAALRIGWLNAPLPERFSRKAVCVLQLCTLIALQVPTVAATVATPVVSLLAVALIWSFALDIRWLWRARP